MPTLSATSPCSMARATSSAAPPRATTVTPCARVWAWATSSRNLRRSEETSRSRSWESASARRFSSIHRMILKTRICGPKGRSSRHEQAIIFGTVVDLAQPLEPSRLAATMAQTRTQGALRRHHRRRRRPRSRCCVLSGQGTWIDEYRRPGKGLYRRRQQRTQYHYHPLELLVQ